MKDPHEALEYLMAQGMSQSEIAQLTGVSQPTISRTIARQFTVRWELGLAINALYTTAVARAQRKAK